MNTELRNKLFNKMKNVFENEDTQEREGYLQAREDVDRQYEHAHRLAVDVVERAYPTEDVAVLRTFKKKYGSPCDVVAKDKCFYFAHNEDKDEDGDIKETKSHFDFGLFGNLNGSEYSDEDGKKFAVAYFREDLKALVAIEVSQHLIYHNTLVQAFLFELEVVCGVKTFFFYLFSSSIK